MRIGWAACAVAGGAARQPPQYVSSHKQFWDALGLWATLVVMRRAHMALLGSCVFVPHTVALVDDVSLHGRQGLSDVQHLHCHAALGAHLGRQLVQRRPCRRACASRAQHQKSQPGACMPGAGATSAPQCGSAST